MQMDTTDLRWEFEPVARSPPNFLLWQIPWQIID
jgi:hypothetical protein